MAQRKTSLADLRVNAPRPLAAAEEETAATGPAAPTGRPYRKKTFEVRPEADREFEILKAELGKSGIELIAEALNMLFRKHGKPEVA